MLDKSFNFDQNNKNNQPINQSTIMQSLVKEVDSWTEPNGLLNTTKKDLAHVKETIEIRRAALDKAGGELLTKIQQGASGSSAMFTIGDEIDQLSNLLLHERKLMAVLAALEAVENEFLEMKEKELSEAVLKAYSEINAMEFKFSASPTVYAESFKNSELKAALEKEIRAKLLLSLWRTLHSKE